MGRRIKTSALLCCALWPGLAQAQPSAGQVEVDLSKWEAIHQEIARLQKEDPPPKTHALVARSVQVEFDRGVLRGRLRVEVQTYQAPVQVPLLDAEASLFEVKLDGARAVAIRSGSFYTVRLEQPGTHRIELGFALGREQARFARAFSVRLPQAPSTKVIVNLPEKELDVSIEGGVILEQSVTAAGTQVEGAFAGKDRLSVRWQRKLSHKIDQVREMEAQALSLVSLSEELLRTQTELRYRLISGETDRVEALLPSAVEVTGVTGDSILQWYTEEAKGGQKTLVVLLKHLVSDEVRLQVFAQSPLTKPDLAELQLVRPQNASLREAHLAIEGRAGFEVTIAKVSGGEQIGIREVPERLRSMSDKPLLYAYRARAAWPRMSLAIKRNAEIDLTQAIIDDLQVSSVLVEQGLEVTKMRLYIRNNTRQYLKIQLPKGANITHALIDGTPFHPAIETGGKRQNLLIPLRQSERLDRGTRQHVVQSGETLGEISLLYFNATTGWKAIVDNNELGGAEDLYIGQVLQIPAKAGGVKFEESNFVVELAYKMQSNALSGVGAHSIALPQLDLPVMRITWHYYFPTAYTPLSFDSNLKQLSAIRYDPLRRIQHFWERMSWTHHAWAGGSYSNILTFRRSIYKKEQQRQVTEALSSFPLVGARYRFERVLLGPEQAQLSLVYMRASWRPFVRWIAYIIALALAWFTVRRALQKRSGWVLSLGSALLGVMALMLVGHYVLGVNRAVLLGLDSGMFIALLPVLWRKLPDRSRFEEPLPIGEVWRWRTLLRMFVAAVVISIMLTFPLLLSTIAFVGLSVLSALYAKKGAAHV